MLATLTDAPFDDAGWVFEDKYDGFRMVAKIEGGKVTLYSRNGKIISHSYIEVAKALEGVKGDAVIDGELVALDRNGNSRFQLLQNALRHEAKLLYCAFDLMFHDDEDLRGMTLLDRKKRLKAVLPRHRLIAFSSHRKASGIGFFKLPTAFSTYFSNRRPSLSVIAICACCSRIAGSTVATTRSRSETNTGSRTSLSVNCFSPAAPSTIATAAA